MTTREFYVAVSKMENTADDVRMKATELLEALDAKNTNAANARKKKKAEENAPIVKAVLDFLTDHPAGACCAEMADAIEGVGSPKISAVCRGLVTEGVLTVSDTKYPGNSRTVKVYTMAPTEQEQAEEDNEENTTEEIDT